MRSNTTPHRAHTAACGCSKPHLGQRATALIVGRGRAGFSDFEPHRGRGANFTDFVQPRLRGPLDEGLATLTEDLAERCRVVDKSCTAT